MQLKPVFFLFRKFYAPRGLLGRYHGVPLQESRLHLHSLHSPCVKERKGERKQLVTST